MVEVLSLPLVILFRPDLHLQVEIAPSAARQMTAASFQPEPFALLDSFRNPDLDSFTVYPELLCRPLVGLLQRNGDLRFGIRFGCRLHSLVILSASCAGSSARSAERITRSENRFKKAGER